MSSTEQIYALFVEANPVADPASLPETYQEQPPLRIVEAPADRNSEVVEPPVFVTRRRPPGWTTALTAAAAVVLVIGLAAVLLNSSDPDTDPPAIAPAVPATHGPSPTTPVEQATTFIERLDTQDIGGAMELLADPLGSIWFPPLGQVTNSDDIRDYLDFYDAVSTTTELSDCDTHISGPRTTVTCQAIQQSEVFAALGLELPVFPMQFHVWEDGIRVIQPGPAGTTDIGAAFSNSRFHEFRANVLFPRGLVQASGDPIWTRSNGDLMRSLVEDFLAENP